MTREEQIFEYANSFKGKGIENDELKEIIRLAIIDGAKWADANPIYKELKGLDEAVEELYPDFSDNFVSKAAVEAVRNAFKAGANWQRETNNNTE